MSDHDLDRDDTEDLDPIEDITALLARSGRGSSDLGHHKGRRKLLEVNQVWGQLLVDTQHFSTVERKGVTLGPTVGYRWRMLGVDMGWVPAPLHLVLPYAPPMWSEVESDWKCDFYGTAQRELFEIEDDGWVAVVDPRWDGCIEVDGERLSFDEAVAAGRGTREGDLVRIPVSEDARLMVEIDAMVYFAHLVHESNRAHDRRPAAVDYPLVAIGSTTTFLGLMFALIVFFAPKPPQADLIEIPEHLVMVMPTPPPELDTPEPPGDPEPEGAKAKRDEGRAGEEDAKMKTARGKKVDVEKLELDRQVADNAGVMGVFGESGALAGIFGSSSLSADLEGGVGGLIGAKGTQIGSGGLAGRGSGLGGGGDAEGIGGMGTHGIGAGDLAYGNGGGAAKKEGTIGITQTSTIIGALDRAVIDEVVKNHMSQLKYCYQRELVKDPTLGGKVVTKFTIARDGSVSSSNIRSSTVGSAAVDHCIQSVFMRMRFPEPMGGGIVIVSYPLMFSL